MQSVRLFIQNKSLFDNLLTRAGSIYYNFFVGALFYAQRAQFLRARRALPPFAVGQSNTAERYKMQTLNTVIKVLTAVVTIFTAYQIFYLLLGIFSPRAKYAPSQKKHRFAVVICARNEERVIGKLIESIHAQTYDKNKIKIFVCADSCSDGTAKLCREMGCTVYERFNTDKNLARKGYALKWLFEHICVDYDVESFDGFAFFDADNVLAPDWFEKMNDAFSTGAGMLTTYRNTKNFDTNFISAAYGIHFYRSSATLHRPRQLLGVSTHIAGTGYVLRSRLLKGGWHFTSLTEDAELTQYMVAAGERVIFCEAAEFFDEQPHNFKVMFRQRLRWAKGKLVIFFKNGWRNLRGIFTQRGAAKKWGNYDIFWYNFPGGLYAALLSVISAVAGVAVSIAAGTAVDEAVAAVSGWDFYKQILMAAAVAYLGYTAQAAVVMIRERKRIHCSAAKKVLYVFTFFWFDLVNLPISVVSLFMRVHWKPIVHDKAFDYDQIIANGKK